MNYSDIISIITAADSDVLDIADTFLASLDESAERYSLTASLYAVSR